MEFTNEELKSLDKYIEQKAQKIIKEEMNKYGIMKGWSAKVSSVNGDGTVNVKLSTDDINVIPNIKNKSGVSLVQNDEVFLFSISSLKNAFIGVKK